MKKIALATAGFALWAFAPASAMAQSTITGILTYQKGNGPVLDCNVTIDLDGTSPSTSTQVTSITFNDGLFGLCQVIWFPEVPNAISQGGSAFTVIDVFANTLFDVGDCRGDLVGTISGEVVNFDAILPEVESDTGDCTFFGSLS